AGTVYTIAEVNADPIRLNSNLGYYTNFMNLMDLCAIAVPAGFQENRLPFGITLFAPAFRDQALCSLGDAIHRKLVATMGATGHAMPPASAGGAGTTGASTSDTAASGAAGPGVRLAVCGAHMSG